MSTRSDTTNSLNARRIDTRKLVTMAMLSAIGLVLAILFKFPLIATATFLKYDPADIPILVGTLVYGPGAGLMMTLVVSVIQSFMVGSSGITGCIMHIAATGSMVLVAGTLYHRSGKQLIAAVYSLLAGCVAMVVVMVAMNLIVTPLFLGQSLEKVIQLLLPAIIPFNALRSGLNSAGAFIVYRGVERLVLRG